MANNRVSLNIISSKNSVKVSEGKPLPICIEIDIPNLACWLMGVIDLRKLYSIGLIEIKTSERLSRKEVDSILTDIQISFGYHSYPICLTPF
ncbi:MAG: hypothetical protein AB7T10_00935 [bacterium]